MSGPQFIDVREKRIVLPPIEEVGNWAKAWKEAFLIELVPNKHEDDTEALLARLIQALINHTHDEVMLKVEKAFVMENRKEVKGAV